MVRRLVLLLLALVAPAAAAAVPAVVGPDWVAANRGEPEVVVLDLQPDRYFRRAHIPGAVNADYKRWRVEGPDGTANMLPPKEKLGDLIRSLGIAEGDHVVVAPLGRGAGDLAMAARVFWTLKVAGLERVSVLEGGLMAYARGKRKRQLESGRARRPEASGFEVALQEDLIADKAATRQAIDGAAVLVDNRSRAEYLGLWRGGRDERPGTVPGAQNLPYDWLTRNGSGRFLDREAAKQVFSLAGVGTDGPQVYFCHSGHRASLAWFVAHALLGNDQARLYDGSMGQWARDDALPMARKVNLD
ncbi:MAG TPA: rhodanese-like domain-containing protein [Gammaproteobacteria bacterium]|nr:rhodanese-like domain-containing protein [Gammaproteobacteria bacterium]